MNEKPDFTRKTIVGIDPDMWREMKAYCELHKGPTGKILQMAELVKQMWEHFKARPSS